MHLPPLATTIVFANENWLWLVIVFGVGALLFLGLGYAKSPLRGWVRWLAMGLKFLGLVLLALCLMEPMLVDENPKKGANDLVVLADNSRGLAVKGGGQGKTAGEEMAELIGGSDGELPGWMEDLSDTFRLQTYTFDSRLKRSADFSDLDFEGDASALLTAVSSIRKRYEKRPLAGMLVFSDGNATDSDLLKDLLADLKKQGAGREEPVPVFPVVAGSDLKGGRDLGIEAVSVAQSPFEDAPVTMTVGVRSFGEFEGSEATIVVTNEKGVEVAREPVSLGKDGKSQKRVQVKGVPPGVNFYNVAVYENAVADLIAKPDELARKAKELTLENNARLVAVDRGKGPYRILYVSGRPNWEFKFMRRSVRADEEIDLVALIRIAKREPKFEWRGREGEMSNPLFRGFNSDVPETAQEYDEPVLIRMNTKDAEELRDGFPKTEEELFANYRAIILDDVESDFFTAEQLNLLDRFVGTRGGTLLMLGGGESFQQGKWNNTPVGRLLPVYLDRISRGAPAHEATFNLTREGWLEPWVRLRSKQEEEDTRLAYMPEFYIVNKIQAIKPGASVFATATDSQQRQIPVLSVQRYGEGNTGALAIGDMWRWGMKDSELRDDLEKFWRQLIRWSVVDVRDRIEVELTRNTDGAVSSIELETRVATEAFRPQDDATVKFEIAGPGGKEGKTEMFGEPSLEEAGLFSSEFYPSEAGGYRVKTSVRDGEGTLIGEKETGWALNPAADEFKSLVPNRTLLEAIADASGGKVLALSEVPDFVNSLPDLKAPLTEKISRPLWHMPWIFLAALACFAGEWALRRWKGIL
ncbi:MAG: hypothetical protein HKN23_08480 [Verrucomicrobiales bacterium]|nr:hypothetical protein [Verrucomicrobiales bacterium]